MWLLISNLLEMFIYNIHALFYIVINKFKKCFMFIFTKTKSGASSSQCDLWFKQTFAMIMCIFIYRICLS